MKKKKRIVLASDADAAENRISRPNYRAREGEGGRPMPFHEVGKAAGGENTRVILLGKRLQS